MNANFEKVSIHNCIALKDCMRHGDGVLNFLTLKPDIMILYFLSLRINASFNFLLPTNGDRHCTTFYRGSKRKVISHFIKNYMLTTLLKIHHTQATE